MNALNPVLDSSKIRASLTLYFPLIPELYKSFESAALRWNSIPAFIANSLSTVSSVPAGILNSEASLACTDVETNADATPS